MFATLDMRAWPFWRLRNLLVFATIVGVGVAGAQIYSSIRGSNSVGRVTAFQAVGREFESRLPLFLWAILLWTMILSAMYLDVGRVPESHSWDGETRHARTGGDVGFLVR